MTEAIYLEVSEKTEAAKCKQRRFSVSGMLKFLGVSRSGYRSWLNRVTSNTQKRKETNHTLINVVQIPVFRFHEQEGKWCLFQYLKEDGNLAAGDRVLIDDRTARGSFIAVLAVEGNICIKCQSIQQILRIHLQEMAARCNEQPYPRTASRLNCLSCCFGIMRFSFSTIPILYHDFLYRGFRILPCTIYILTSHQAFLYLGCPAKGQT